MVNPRNMRPFIDREIPDSQDARKLLAPTRQDATAIWLGEEGPGKGRVTLDAESGLEQVADVESAPFPPVGSVVPVALDSSGRVARIYAPTVQDLSEATPVGDAAQRLLESATSEYVDAELAEARTELESAKTELEGAITAANEDIAEVAGVASTANAAAATAHTLASSKSRVTTGPAYPADPAVGDLHFLLATRDGELVIDGLKIRTATGWADYKLYVDSVAAVNSIAARQIIASEELSAKAGEFLTVRTDQLVAGNAKIAGELIADEITGKIVRGGLLDGTRVVGDSIEIRPPVAGNATGSTLWEQNFNSSIANWAGNQPGASGPIATLARDTSIKYSGAASLRATYAGPQRDGYGFVQTTWQVSGDSYVLTPIGEVISNGVNPRRLTFRYRLAYGTSTYSINKSLRATLTVIPLEAGWSSAVLGFEAQHYSEGVTPGVWHTGTIDIPASVYKIQPRVTFTATGPTDESTPLTMWIDDVKLEELPISLSSLRLALDSDRIPVLSMDGPSGTEQLRMGQLNPTYGYYGLALFDKDGTRRSFLHAAGDESGLFSYPVGATAWSSWLGSHGLTIRGTGGSGGPRLTLENPPTSTFAANMGIANNNVVYKVSSLRRHKHDIQDAPETPSLLDLRVRTWVDKEQAYERAYAIERNANREAAGQLDQMEPVPELKRISGVIAEEVWELTGREELMSWAEDGNFDGIQYDRLGLEYAREAYRWAKSRITQLETENASILERLERLEAANGNN